MTRLTQMPDRDGDTALGACVEGTLRRVSKGHWGRVSRGHNGSVAGQPGRRGFPWWEGRWGIECGVLITSTPFMLRYAFKSRQYDTNLDKNSINATTRFFKWSSIQGHMFHPSKSKKWVSKIEIGILSSIYLSKAWKVLSKTWKGSIGVPESFIVVYGSCIAIHWKPR